MKLSFSLSSKPSSRTNPSRSLAAVDADDQGREFVTVFDPTNPSRSLAAADADDQGREFVTVFDPSQTLAADDQGREFVTVFDPSQTLAADAPSKKGIGRNNSKGDIKVVQYERRTGTAGLGYNPSPSDPKKKRGEWVFNNDNKVKYKSNKIRISKVERRGEKKREKDVSFVHRSSTSSSSSHIKEGSVSVRWLTSHIKVRVISKEFMRGKLYLKKGMIVDVVGPTTCDISIDESRELVQGLDQDMLETVVPKRGGSVLVLYGKHKGVYGTLFERNLEEETGVVRDADSHYMFNVRLDQIAEYVGDPAYLGY